VIHGVLVDVDSRVASGSRGSHRDRCLKASSAPWNTATGLRPGEVHALVRSDVDLQTSANRSLENPASSQSTTRLAPPLLVTQDVAMNLVCGFRLKLSLSSRLVDRFWHPLVVVLLRKCRSPWGYGVRFGYPKSTSSGIRLSFSSPTRPGAFVTYSHPTATVPYSGMMKFRVPVSNNHQSSRVSS
jgi:hypothetical protein